MLHLLDLSNFYYYNLVKNFIIQISVLVKKAQYSKMEFNGHGYNRYLTKKKRMHGRHLILKKLSNGTRLVRFIFRYLNK